MSRRSTSLFSVVLLIAAIALGVFVWQPARDRALEGAKTLETAQSELQGLEEEVATLVQLEAELPVGETERARILDAVPLSLVQEELVEDLSTIADSVGVSLNSTTFSLQSSRQQNPHVVSMVSNLNGHYDDLIRLMKALESNDRLFKITSIGVQLGELDEEGNQQMIFSVSMEAYYQD